MMPQIREIDVKSDNPSEFAEVVSHKFSTLGYSLDFTVKSLETQIDLILLNEQCANSEESRLLEKELTAYFGETLCRELNAEWKGQYFGPLQAFDNYYTCRIIKGDFEFGPSHFFGYYFANGSDKKNPFYDYLHYAYYSIGTHNYVEPGILWKMR